MRKEAKKKTPYTVMPRQIQAIYDDGNGLVLHAIHEPVRSALSNLCNPVLSLTRSNHNETTYPAVSSDDPSRY